MALPRLEQYQAAVQNPAVAFADPQLKAARLSTNPLRLPKVVSGGFALTYQLSNGRQSWAIRCFHKEARDLERRYAAFTPHIRATPGGFFVPIEYQPRGILVQGQWYPVTKMLWLQAVGLGRYVETHLRPMDLAALERRFIALVQALEARGIAHGDLQHGNLLVDERGKLRLIDYDGMYVPELANLAANESGHPNYQHPSRTNQFDSSLDRFSVLVIVCALRALAVKPSLWKTYDNSDNLLFKHSDFRDPANSPLFRELKSIEVVRDLSERLASVARSDYSSVPRIGDFLGGKVRLMKPAAVPRP